MFSIVIWLSETGVILKETNIHKVLSSNTRREIILFLSDGKKYLTEIAEHVHKTPQTADFHLSLLENINLIKSSEAEGKKYYELKDREILKFLREKRPLPHRHHPKPPHEIVLDIKDELNERMDRIEKKLDLLLKKKE
jgi:DNA-binding transcriptional ArsR family regulator